MNPDFLVTGALVVDLAQAFGIGCHGLPVGNAQGLAASHPGAQERTSPQLALRPPGLSVS
jgi:hypothetical protein